MNATAFIIDDEEAARRRLRRRSVLFLILAFWALAVLMLSIRALIIDAFPLSVLGPRRLMLAVVGALLCLGMARILAALSAVSFAWRIVWGVLGAFAMATTLTFVTMAINRIILPFPGAPPFSLAESAQWVLVWLGYFLAWTGTHLALTYHWESQDYQRRVALLAETTREAQRSALRYQLNPHFLFNTLNSVAALVGEGRAAEAETMLVNLATFVRSTLTDEPSGTIPLREEIELQRLYLDIERVRFDERLRVEIALPEALAGAPVPALILQPLIENAVRHGLDGAEQPLTIRILAAERSGRLEISVEDDGKADPSAARPGGGLGLGNVAARLAAHFGEAGALAAAPLPGGGFRAVLSWPKSP